MQTHARGRWQQRGMSVWQTLIVLVVAGIGLTIIVAIGPLFIKNSLLLERFDR